MTDMSTETLRWRCTDCGDVFETEPTRHDPDSCECGEAFVDHEAAYIRRNLKAEQVLPDA